MKQLPAKQQQQQQPEREPDTHLTKLLKLLSKYPVTSWLAGLAERLIKGPSPSSGNGSGSAGTSDSRVLRLVRMILALGAFCVMALFREASLQNARVKPREVLYSTFVSLLDEGKVKAARLESGSGRMYFDMQMPAETATADAVPTATVVASAAATAATTPFSQLEGTALASSSQPVPALNSTEAATVAAAAGAATAAAPSSTSASSTTPYRMQRHCYIKLADKNDPLLINRVLTAGVEFAVIKTSFQGYLANILLSSLALWLPLLPLLFLVRRILEDRSSSSRKKRSSGAENVTVTFADVAGVDSAKEELTEVVSVMKASKSAYSKLRVKMPSGVLLCGPPGTGKTLLAKAVAGEAGIPFIAVSASEFVEMYVGRGAARIRELFSEARKVSPCVVFIDELDAVGARRGMGYNDERDQTLNQLLTELDGFEGRPGVLFLAATNRMDVLDPALLRPGRLSRKVVVPLPDEAGRRDILAVHMRNVPLSEEEPKSEVVLRLARVTPGFSGAELANVVNEAALLAARKSQDEVSFRELLEGVQRTRYGVNGRTPGSANSLQQSLSNWLIGLAGDSPSAKKAKNAVA